MHRIRWRIVFPVVQILIAFYMLWATDTMHHLMFVGLGYNSSETQKNLNEVHLGPWDQYDPLLDLSISMNFPALTIALPAVALGVRRPPLTWIVYLLGVGIFWYWIGLGLDRRLGNIHARESHWTRRLKSTIFGLGIVWFGFTGIVSSHYVMSGPIFHLRLLCLAFFTWSALLVGYLAVNLYYLWKPGEHVPPLVEI